MGLYLDSRFFRLDLGAYSEEIGENVGDRPDARYYGRMMFGF